MERHPCLRTHLVISRRGTLALRLVLVCGLLIAGSSAAQTNGGVVATDTVSGETHGPWLSAEGGVHTADWSSTRVHSGQYGRIAFTLPIGSTFGFLLFLDGWRLPSHGGLGAGMTITIAREGALELSSAVGIFIVGEAGALLVPLSISYEAIRNILRLQWSVSLRTEAQLSMGGGDSHTFWCTSIGVGIDLANVMPRNPPAH